MASDSDSGTEYEVKEILGERKQSGKRALEYLVRWKGFTSESDSWVPYKQLTGAKAALKVYRDKLKTPSKTTKSRSRSRSSSRSRSTSKGRGRAKSKSKSPARQKRATPVRQSRQTTEERSSTRGRSGVVETVKTDVVTEEPGRYERTQVVTQTVTDYSEADGAHLRKKESESKDQDAGPKNQSFLQRWWNCDCAPMAALRSLDGAVLVAFIVITAIAVSFLLEKFVDFGQVWGYIVGLFSWAWGKLTGLFS